MHPANNTHTHTAATQQAYLSDFHVHFPISVDGQKTHPLASARMVSVKRTLIAHSPRSNHRRKIGKKNIPKQSRAVPPPSSSPHYRVVPGRLAPLPRTATSQCRTAAMRCAAISPDRARAAASLQGVVNGAFVHHLLLFVRKLLVRV